MAATDRAEYFAANGSPLCPACRVGDGRRAAALIDRPDYQNLSFERIVCQCALCDAHGFLVTARNADSEAGTAARQKINKDTLHWVLFVKDQKLREKRHHAILRALRDSLVSPDGALVATMLPHLTGLRGAIMVRTGVGRSPLYSALEKDFVTRLGAMADESCRVYPFETIDAFYTLMNDFIAMSVPAIHPFWRTSEAEQ